MPALTPPDRNADPWAERTPGLLRDDDLLNVVTAGEQDTAVQLEWLITRMKQAAPQALVVA